MNNIELDLPNSHVNDESVTIKVVVDLEDHCINGLPHPGNDPGIIVYYLIKINDRKIETKKSHMLGREIITLYGKNPNDFLLYQNRRKHGETYLEPIGRDEIIDFTIQGIESFVVKPKMYRFSIGKKEYESISRHLTVGQILVDFAHVDTNSNTLSTKQGHEYKNLNEVVDIECINQFVLFNDEPTPVS